MSRHRSTQPVVPFCGIIFNNNIEFDNILIELIIKFGEILSYSEPIPFDWTDYYLDEMGDNLSRSWVAFKELIIPDKICKMKHIAYDIENEYSENRNRIINIDPGYIALPRLVLSTYKDFSHRIYVGDRVYCEVTLIFTQNKWQTLPWTFTDYRDEKNQKYFSSVRNYLKNELIQKDLLERRE